MTTATKLAEQVIRILASGDPSDDNTLDKREVVLLVKQVLSEQIRRGYFENLQVENLHATSDIYVALFKNIPVYLDTDLNQYYANLPAFFINLPGGKGLRQVSDMKAPSKHFIISANGTDDLFAGMGLQGNIGGYVEGSRWMFEKGCCICYPEKVLMKLVVGNGPNDPFPISEDAEIMVIREVLNLLGRSAELPQDKVNDSNKQK